MVASIRISRLHGHARALHSEPEQTAFTIAWFIIVAYLTSGTSCQRPASADRLICSGDKFVTDLINVILDRNRETIRQNEPNLIGNRTENIGLFVLQRARAFNLSKAQFHGPVRVNCASRDAAGMAVVQARIELPDPVFLFDYVLPGHMGSGKVIVTAAVLGQIVTLHVPLKVNTGERVLIHDMGFYRSDNFKISFTGLGPATRALSSLLWLTYRLTPQVSLQLYKVLAMRSLQDYIDRNPLPL